MSDKLRFQEMPTCTECNSCTTAICNVVRRPLRRYDGIRLTADKFDCALPVTIDTHSRCSFGCVYCFSDNLMGHKEVSDREIGQTSITSIEKILSGVPGKSCDIFREALNYGNGRKYPCPIQVGGLNDPADNIERQQGFVHKIIDLAIKYNQPFRFSTKGKLFGEKDYLDHFSKAPHLFWVAFSIISPDDELMLDIDYKAPSPSERIETMRRLSNIGVKTSLRFRPMMPGVSDRTKRHKYAYKDLIHMAAEAGARAISYECLFLPSVLPAQNKEKWSRLYSIIGHDLKSIYRSFGPLQACTRPSYLWTESIMHAVAEESRLCGMTVGISDPVWKQLGDTGCCCGILPDDEVFGNWDRKSATNQLLEAKNTGKKIYFNDVTPDWAYKVRLGSMINIGVGPMAKYSVMHHKWADFQRGNWNNLKAQRSPVNYFQGALIPCGIDDNGDRIYEYKGLERGNKPESIWRTE